MGMGKKYQRKKKNTRFYQDNGDTDIGKRRHRASHRANADSDNSKSWRINKHMYRQLDIDDLDELGLEQKD